MRQQLMFSPCTGKWTEATCGRKRHPTLREIAISPEKQWRWWYCVHGENTCGET